MARDYVTTVGGGCKGLINNGTGLHVCSYCTGGCKGLLIVVVARMQGHGTVTTL